MLNSSNTFNNASVMEAMDIVARGPAQTSLMLNLLPPELLLMIFAYFAPARNQLPDQEYWLDRSDLFAVRSTCRAFRFIANELLFWVDDDFRVVETIPRRLSSFEDDSFDATFLELILSDRHLLASLAKRKVWHFKNITTLRVVLLKVPSFRRQPVSVHLLFDKLSSGYWLRTSFNVAISELFACHCLTSLVLLDNMDDVYQNSEPHQLIDLDLIVQCCPTITLLRLICTHLVGTLRHLSTLQSLVADNINIRNPSAFLPVQSTHSLTHLSVLLDKSEFLFESACTDGTFALFVNLTTLFVHPLTDPMCDVLMGGHFRLKHFRTTAIPRFGHLNLIKVIVMFSESSLRGLQSLTMAFEDNYEWRSSHSDLALAIATNLRRLNTLVIGMGIDPAWCSHFSSLIAATCLVRSGANLAHSGVSLPA
jgi:hypothetical protein